METDSLAFTLSQLADLEAVSLKRSRPSFNKVIMGNNWIECILREPFIANNGLMCGQVRVKYSSLKGTHTRLLEGDISERERERDKTTTFNLNRHIAFGLKQRVLSRTKHCVTSKKYVIDYEPAFVHC